MLISAIPVGGPISIEISIDNVSYEMPSSVVASKNGYILIFAAPVPFQINAIHIHIGILSTLKWPVSPLFDVFVCLLVQFADR